MTKLLKPISIAVATAGLLGAAGSAAACVVDVSITNITRGQIFSPPVAWSHNAAFGDFFAFGGEASEELRLVAEEGDPFPLANSLEGNRSVQDLVIADGPIPPGETATLTLDIDGSRRLISMASMLVNTNDTFFATRGASASCDGGSTLFLPGLDAGTEANTEDCSDIPGPACAGIDGDTNNRPTEGAEGFIFTQEGIHGPIDGPPTSDLVPGETDWRNPVAFVVITRAD